MPTREEVIEFVSNNLDSPQLIFDTAQQYGVTPEDIASFTGYPLMQVYSYFNDAGINNPSRVFSGGDVSGFIQENIEDPNLIYQAMRFYGLTPDYVSSATGYTPLQVRQYFSDAGISDFDYPTQPPPDYAPRSNAPIHPQIDNTQSPGTIARQLHDRFQQQRQVSPSSAQLAQTYGYGTGPAYAPQVPFYSRFYGGRNDVTPEGVQNYFSLYPDVAEMYADPDNTMASGRTPGEFAALHYSSIGSGLGYESPYGADPLFAINRVPQTRYQPTFTERGPGSTPVLPERPGGGGGGGDGSDVDADGGGPIGADGGGFGDDGTGGFFGGWESLDGVGFGDNGGFGEVGGVGGAFGAEGTSSGDPGEWRKGGIVRRR